MKERKPYEDGMYEVDTLELPSTIAMAKKKAAPKKAKEEDDDEDVENVDDGEWGKGSNDFDDEFTEFEPPVSKTKKKAKVSKEDDLGLDEDFDLNSDLGLHDDLNYEDEDDF